MAKCAKLISFSVFGILLMASIDSFVIAAEGPITKSHFWEGCILRLKALRLPAEVRRVAMDLINAKLSRQPTRKIEAAKNALGTKKAEYEAKLAEARLDIAEVQSGGARFRDRRAPEIRRNIQRSIDFLTTAIEGIDDLLDWAIAHEPLP